MAKMQQHADVTHVVCTPHLSDQITHLKRTKHLNAINDAILGEQSFGSLDVSAYQTTTPPNM